MSFDLQFLDAEEGDAIWVRWGDQLEHQLLVDMGRGATGKSIKKQIEALDDDQRHFELLVISHVDADHIAGALTGLIDGDQPAGLTFGDIWFNGWAHLHGERVPRPDANMDGLESLGPAQGEEFSRWLESAERWNEAYDRKAVERGVESLETHSLAGGLGVTVLGPTRAGLENLIDRWEVEVRNALRTGRLTTASPGLEPMGRRKKPTRPNLPDWNALEDLASTETASDASKANGSSISLLLEYMGRRVLLTGDAWSSDITSGLQMLGEGMPVELELVKLPHHGSDGNCTDDLLDAIHCRRWVISTNGSRHYHPDQVAVARLLRQHREPRPELLFNVPSEFNQWWEDRQWQQQFSYSTCTGSDGVGLVVEL